MVKSYHHTKVEPCVRIFFHIGLNVAICLHAHSAVHMTGHTIFEHFWPGLDIRIRIRILKKGQGCLFISLSIEIVFFYLHPCAREKLKSFGDFLLSSEDSMRLCAGKHFR